MIDSIESVALSFAEYQAESRKTAIYKPMGTKGEMYPVLGLANEAGEVLGKIKKIYRDKDGEYSEEDLSAVGDELADVLWYAAQIATDLGLSLEYLMSRNLEKLQSRQERGVLGGSGDKR